MEDSKICNKIIINELFSGLFSPERDLSRLIGSVSGEWSSDSLK